MNQEIKAQEYARVLQELHARWLPHTGQIPIGRAIFIDELDEIFLECGRNFGKTEFIDYLYWRVALTRHGTFNYLFYPTIKQGREVVWKSNRMTKFGPEKYIESTNDTEMRINFINGSFVKIDGSDNVDSYRGVKIRGGGLWGYDEYKDHKPEFHEAVDPNLLECIVIFAGTPPYGDSHFTQTADQVKENPKGFYINRTCYDNPHIPVDKIEKAKKRLESIGEYFRFQCEYLAMRVKGGPGHLLPQVAEYKLRKHAELMAEIEKDRHHMEWISFTDPGSATTHGTLLGCHNIYKKKIYWLDEVYETRTTHTATSQIGPRIIKAALGLHPNLEDWRFGYDEAAVWFKTEMEDQSITWKDEKGELICPDGVFYEPTEKALNKKENGLSLIKDLFLHNRVEMSEKCKKTKWEMDNYYKDDKGKIPKINDHNIDNARYFLAMAGYEFDLENPPVPEAETPERGYTFEDDFPELVDEYAEYDSGYDEF